MPRHLTIPRMSSEDRRAAILEAAIRLFAERGYRGATTRALAEAVGVTEPVLYEHFKSKHELYAAIIESKSREGVERGMALLAPYAEKKDDRGLFTALGEFMLGRIRDDAAYTRLLLFAALEDPKLGDLFHRHRREARQLLAGYVAQRIADGAFREVNPELAVRAFFGMLCDHGQSHVLYGDQCLSAAPDQIVREMVDIFLRGIRSDRNGGK